MISSADNVWKIGNGIWRFDGDTWNDEADPLLSEEFFEGLEVLSKTGVWLGSSKGSFYHYNGTDWTQHVIDRPRFVRDIVAISEDDIWAVGRGYADDLPTGYVAHWDGMSWTVQDSGCARELTQVVVQDDDNAWVAGRGARLRWQRR